jgi:RNA polymerase sigma-70 factor (ECF subfamily)
MAFEALYEKYWADVLDEAFRRLGDIDQAKDVAQEVFTFLWTRAADNPIINFPAWLNTVVRNQVYRQIKNSGNFVPIPEILLELESHGDNADAKILSSEFQRTYAAMIDALPEQQRVIFKMRYEDNLSPEEIAAALQISPKTVRNHLGRALSKLKTALVLFHVLLFLSSK